MADSTNYKRFDCRCGLPSHYVSVWLDDDLGRLAGAEGDFELVIGTPAQTWMPERIRQAWLVLRGRHAEYESVILSAGDARRLRGLLDDYIERSERAAS